jgi:hypothetical protein
VEAGSCSSRGSASGWKARRRAGSAEGLSGECSWPLAPNWWPVTFAAAKATGALSQVLQSGMS